MQRRQPPESRRERPEPTADEHYATQRCVPRSRRKDASAVVLDSDLGRFKRLLVGLHAEQDLTSEPHTAERRVGTFR
jgi:hypothetical protein